MLHILGGINVFTAHILALLDIHAPLMAREFFRKAALERRHRPAAAEVKFRQSFPIRGWRKLFVEKTIRGVVESDTAETILT